MISQQCSLLSANRQMTKLTSSANRSEFRCADRVVRNLPVLPRSASVEGQLPLSRGSLLLAEAGGDYGVMVCPSLP